MSLEVRADPTHVLMSDVLKGQVPEVESEFIEHAAQQHVIVIAEYATGASRSSVVGILRGVLFGPEPEIAFCVNLKEALDIIDTSGLTFGGFELHHGERIVKMPGPFCTKEARIDEINPNEQLCTLGLHLRRGSR